LRTGKIRGSKSGLLPKSYAALSFDEKEKVKAAFLEHNKKNPHDPFFEPELFYHRIFKKGSWSK
jgi:hypothetical protein